MLGVFQFMKIGNLDIRWPRVRARVDTSVVGKDMSGVFAISEFEPWWLALHQTLNELEQETIDAARASTGRPYNCIAAVGASEGVAMVRMRLIEKRANALREKNSLT
jgi:hypothetical protein